MGRLEYILRRRIKNSGNINGNIDEIIAHLQSKHPEDYQRTKLKQFRKLVEKTLNSLQKKSQIQSEEEEDQEEKINSGMKRKRSESSLSLSCMSDDGAVSTSEDVSKKLKKDSKKEEEKEIEDCNEGKKLLLIDGRGNDIARVKPQRKFKGTGQEKEKVKGRDDRTMFKDFGGMEKILKNLKVDVIIPFYRPELFRNLNPEGKPISGILLHGPPGCGKTKLANAIANEAGVPFYQISATDVVSGVSGASEEKIRDLFSKAYRTAPSVVFIDEIDAIALKREILNKGMERRIVTQLMTCMDESHQNTGLADIESDSGTSARNPAYVLVIGATNRLDDIDSALRRPGRFCREICLGVPNEEERRHILSILTSNCRLEGAIDHDKLARSTPSFVGADLAALVNEAGILAVTRYIYRRNNEQTGENNEEWWKRPLLPKKIENYGITMADFEKAAKAIQPSSRREGFAEIPDVKWEDIGGHDSLRKEFESSIVNRIRYREINEKFGVNSEVGILLYGPPGCGKTLIAKAVANEATANFIHIKGPEILNKYVGESESQIRTIFSRARTCAPCIIFFDEVDALTTKRGEEGGGVVDRLLNQLLIELDGAGQRQGVYVIGATNRREVMDDAILRPGRFGKQLNVPLPSPEERGLILKALARKKPIAEDVDLVAIGKSDACANLSGADLSAVINEAATAAVNEYIAAVEEKQMSGLGRPDKRTDTINLTHFEEALKKVSPSVSNKQNTFTRFSHDASEQHEKTSATAYQS